MKYLKIKDMNEIQLIEGLHKNVRALEILWEDADSHPEKLNSIDWLAGMANIKKSMEFIKNLNLHIKLKNI